MTENDNNMVMPVAPMYGGMGNGFGNSFGGDWAWIILLLLLAGNNGWGNGFGGADGMMPYMLNTQTQNDVNRGFADAALTSQISAIQTTLAANELANSNRANDIQAQLATCCCENRLATNDLKYTIATEACNNRAASTANTQAILDKLCQLELDGKNDRIADLERQLTMANLAASQTAQTAQLLNDNTRQTIALEQYLNPTPVPAYIVQNPNCCAQNYGCSCA